MRGCPGSGKSTLAHSILLEAFEDNKTHIRHSTDNYFMKDGTYVFNVALLHKNHLQNLNATINSLKEGVSLIVVDNTNTTFKECDPYIKAGLEANYLVKFVEPTTTWAKNPEELFQRNTHSVPLENIKKMLARWEETYYIGETAAQKYGANYNHFDKTLSNKN